MAEILFVIVDFQNDFVSGTLAVPDAEATIDAIITTGRAVEEVGGEVVFTRDWHPHNHSSFNTDGNPTFTDGDWPVHCVQGTAGAEIHPRLREAFPGARIFSKGQDVNTEQYSGFEAVDEYDRTLFSHAMMTGVREVLVAGLALDYCVGNTLFDFWATGGLATTLVLDGTRPVAFETGADTLLRMGHYDQSDLRVMRAEDAVEWVLGQ